MQCSRKRLQVKPRKRQKDLPVGWRENQRRCYNRKSSTTNHCKAVLLLSYHTTDKFAIARAVLLLCPSRSPKSCSVHVEKVIVFSFCFCPFACIMPSSLLGDCTSETLPGKCSPSLLYYTMPAVFVALLATYRDGGGYEWQRKLTKNGSFNDDISKVKFLRNYRPRF